MPLPKLDEEERNMARLVLSALFMHALITWSGDTGADGGRRAETARDARLQADALLAELES